MTDLADKVVAAAAAWDPSKVRPIYTAAQSLDAKITEIATKVYGADKVAIKPAARARLQQFTALGYGELPVCIAKTQYSFSTDPQLRGAPSGHVVNVREVRLAAGAEFVVLVCGEIMTMPGLPRVPAANNIELTEDGRITGLF